MQKALKLALDSVHKPIEHVGVTGITAFLGIFTSYAFGGWSEAMSFLFVVMAVDYLTGCLASVKEGKGLSSSVGGWGLAKKGLMLLVILLSHRADVLLESNNIAVTGAIYFYIANELISIIENFGRLGLPLPAQLKNLIAVLQNKGDKP